MRWVEHLACMQTKGNIYIALARKHGQTPDGKFGHRQGITKQIQVTVSSFVC
jgi:hypothetical protein